MCGKVVFEKKAEAREFVNTAKLEGSKVYFDPICCCWHITNHKKRSRFRKGGTG